LRFYNFNSTNLLSSFRFRHQTAETKESTQESQASENATTTKITDSEPCSDELRLDDGNSEKCPTNPETEESTVQNTSVTSPKKVASSPSNPRIKPQKSVEDLMAQKKRYQRHLRQLQQTQLARQIIGRYLGSILLLFLIKNLC